MGLGTANLWHGLAHDVGLCPIVLSQITARHGLGHSKAHGQVSKTSWMQPQLQVMKKFMKNFSCMDAGHCTCVPPRMRDESQLF